MCVLVFMEVSNPNGVNLHFAVKYLKFFKKKFQTPTG